jgi:hypothetical protein
MSIYFSGYNKGFEYGSKKVFIYIQPVKDFIRPIPSLNVH